MLVQPALKGYKSAESETESEAKAVFKTIDNKILAIAVVAVMACAIIPIAAIDGVDSDADSATTYGSFNFWFNYGSGWSSTPISGDGYNACIALQDACSDANIALSFMTIDGVSAADFTKTVDYYSTVNSDYGTVDTIGEKSTTDDEAWYAYYYYDGVWNEALDSIGFYKPFSDYDANFRTANMAFYYGEDAVDASSIPTESMAFQSIVQVPTDSTAENAADFAVTFNIKLAYTQTIAGKVCDDVPGSDGTAQSRLAEGVIVTGYGSDAALALKNALTSIGCSHYAIYTDVSSVNSEGDTVINASSYGYCTKLFGVYEDSKDNDGDEVDDEYWYWSLYLGDGTTSYASYLLGWYSPLSGVVSGFCQDVFTIHYAHSAW